MKNINNSAITLRWLLKFQTQKHPQKKFIYFPKNSDSGKDIANSESLSYQNIEETSQQIALHFYQQGLNKGDIILVAMPNGQAALELFMGCLYGGFTVLFLNLVGNSQWEYIIGHCQPKLMVCEPSYFNTLKKLADHNNIQTIIKQDSQTSVIPTLTNFLTGFSNNNHSITKLPEIHPHDRAVLMYTSGTTGKPKGVVLSQMNVISGGQNTSTAHELNENAVGLCVLPLYHINAQMVSIMSTLVCGGTVVLPPSFSVANFWHLIAHYRCNWFSVVPTQINYLIHRSTIENLDLSCVEFGRSASAPLSPEVHKNFEKLFGINIVETMGLTETAAQILSNPRDHKKQKYGTPGIAIGNEVKIVGDNLVEKSRREVGEIAVKGNNVMLEYLNNPLATANTIIDGWLLTGDLGYQDEDGFVFVTGRKKEIIIKGGENISPREVDDILYFCDEVIEAATFGVTCPNYGQDLEVAIVLKPNSTINESTILKLCEENLGTFKKPRKVHFLKELPKGPSGKIQRNRILELISKN